MTELTDEELQQLVEEGSRRHHYVKPDEYDSCIRELLATMRAGIAADRAARPQPTAEALQAAYVEWFKAEHLNNAPSPTAARTAAQFTLAVLLGEVEV